MFTGVFESSMMWKAQKDEIVQLETINLRDFGLGSRRQVDDTPYGGGDGMLLMIEPLWRAVKFAKSRDESAKVILTSPRGQRWHQAKAQSEASSGRGLIFICGRYEGVDERILEVVDEQWSIGDFVLTGGELPAMAVIDSIVRLIPGVLGGEKSAEIESFSAHGVNEVVLNLTGVSMIHGTDAALSDAVSIMSAINERSDRHVHPAA